MRSGDNRVGVKDRTTAGMATVVEQSDLIRVLLDRRVCTTDNASVSRLLVADDSHRILLITMARSGRR